MSAIPGVLRVVDLPAAPGAFPPAADDEARVFPIVDATTTLGRGLHNAIVLFDPTVSRDHAALTHASGAWSVTNHSHTSPTLVAGVPLAPGDTVAIVPGQTLRLGGVTLQLVAPDLPPSLQSLAASGAGLGSVGSTLLRSSFSLRALVRASLRGGGRAIVLGVVVAFLMTLALVVFGVGALITQRAAQGSAGWLVIPLIPAAGVVALIALIDRYERKPWYVLLSAFLWGAVIAIPPALFIELGISAAINNLMLPPGMWGDVAHSALLGLNAGLTEETVKGAGLLVLVSIVRDKFTSISDGIMYGALIGAGFAMIENVAYFANADSRHALAFLIIGRVVLGWLGHSTFTGIFGAALGYVRERRPAQMWRVPLLGFGLAVLLHTLFDAIGFQATTAQNASSAPVVTVLAQAAIVLDYVPLFAAQFALYTLLMRSLARETAILRAALVEDVCRGVVTPDEYLLLQAASPRTRLERALLLGHGLRFWRAARQLQAAIVGLGFACWQNPATPGASPAISPTVYRARIRRLRRTIASYETAGKP